MEGVNERKKQDLCSGCNKQIADPEKECPTCGTFPHRAYHERSASKILNLAKWVQSSPVMQPNQKLTENSHELINIISFDNF